MDAVATIRFYYCIRHPTQNDREDVHLEALRFGEVRLGCPYPRLSRLPRRARSRPLCTCMALELWP